MAHKWWRIMEIIRSMGRHRAWVLLLRLVRIITKIRGVETIIIITTKISSSLWFSEIPIGATKVTISSNRILPLSHPLPNTQM